MMERSMSLVACVRALAKALRKFTAATGDPAVLPVWRYQFRTETNPPGTAKRLRKRLFDALNWLCQRIEQANATGTAEIGAPLRKGRLIGSQFQFRQDATETMRLIFDRNTAEIGNRLATLLLTPMPAAVKDLLADHRP